MLELYIHIPFCVRKCLYCDFLSFAASEDVRQRYVDKLAEEIKSCGKKPGMAEKKVISVFLGGGTPSILTPSQLEKVMEAVRESFRLEPEAEITIEANPGTCSEEGLRVWREAGINRLSLGLQSTHTEELKQLGRIHSYEEFLETFRMAREQGFSNINVDLMAALPGQTEASWRETLRRVTDLSPEHISAYSLIIEDGTPFYASYGQMNEDLEKYGDYDSIPESRKMQYGDVLPLPGEDTDRKMYHFTKEFLKENGYEHYEVSNYARPGRECVHNCGYWTGTDYLGIGLGAASLMEGERFSVTRSLETYLGLSVKELERGEQYENRESLSVSERMEEFMFLGLRMTDGVRADVFERRFGCMIESVYGEVFARLREEGLLEFFGEGEERRYRLTEYGLDVSNCVLAEFLL